MAAKNKPAPVPTLPTLAGTAYSADALAPVITAWLQSHGVAKIVDGTEVRDLVRGGRKGVTSPVPRVAVKPPFGNRVHLYTITESAEVFATFARLAGQPDMAPPAPFRGHGVAKRVTRPKTATNRRVDRTGRATSTDLPPANTSDREPMTDA